MPRKYRKSSPTLTTTDPFAAQLSAAMRPMIDAIVTERIAQFMRAWLQANAPDSVHEITPAGETVPEVVPPKSESASTPKPNGGAKRDPKNGAVVPTPSASE
jgi:hypothetical protein